MAIFNVEPKTSKVTGGVLIDITGNNFAQTPFQLNPLTSNVIDRSITPASIVDDTQGLTLVLPELLNKRAAFEIDRDFPEAFKILISYDLEAQSLPLIKNAILVGIEAVNKNNPSNVIRFYISYTESNGYQIVLEEKLGTSILYRRQQNIDPYAFEDFGIHAGGKFLHGFIKPSGTELFVLKSNPINISEYRVILFSETPEVGVPLNSEVTIKRVLALNAVSFIGYPTEIVSFTDTKIKFKTFPGEISAGDVIVSSADLSIQKKAAEFKYVFGNGIANIAKQFDTIQAIYGQYVIPTREQLFKSQDGFQWDENYFLTEDSRNKELAVLSLWDPTTGNIPKTFFQSGVGPYQALKVEAIEKVISEDKENWYPKIKHGTYFIENVPYYLFSDQSIIEYLKEDLTTDGRSIHPLLFRPKFGIPVSVFSLTEDRETKITLQKKRLVKKASFTGKVVNGVELDTLNPANIDLSKDEFIVTINNNNEVINWIIPVAPTPALGIYSFTLPEVPLNEFNLIFSRTDIFRQEKTIASRYGEATYGSFLYGEGIENFGDYTINYQTGEVSVSLEYLYKDLGVASFVFDYPAIIEFNKNFTFNKGSDITDPTFSDLGTLDNLGYSSGTAGQEFRLNDFPIIDNSTIFLADNNNYKIFIYDEYDNSFDGSWTRVLNLKDFGPNDKVYEVNSSNGMLKFGDGIHGKIPTKYLKILAGYKPTMKIQYEPETSNDYWLPKTTDLNLTKQNINSGFLYLNRKKLVPSQIVAEFSSNHISVFETTDISATVYTQDNEVIPGVVVNFELLNGGGRFKDQDLITNPNGYVSTIYTPSSRLEDMAVKIELFAPGTDTEIPGSQLPNNYGSKGGIPYVALKSQELIQGDLDEILVFKILDDGDDFLPYNNITRKGGRIVLHYKSLPTPTPVRGDYVAGSIIGFVDQLPQPFDPYAPNYEPNLRGFYIVGKKTIQARAYVSVGDINIYSNIVGLTTEYSLIQKGTWTLPTPPLSYDHSQINTATYIDINV